MATQHVNTLKHSEVPVAHTHRTNWEIMKPFVLFSFKAIKFIGIALFAIVKGVLSLKPLPKQTRKIDKY